MREVALRLGITVSDAKTRHHRANRFLNQLLSHVRTRQHEVPGGRLSGHSPSNRPFPVQPGRRVAVDPVNRNRSTGAGAANQHLGRGKHSMGP